MCACVSKNRYSGVVVVSIVHVGVSIIKHVRDVRGTTKRDKSRQRLHELDLGDR